jgi:hypothetical protein
MAVPSVQATFNNFNAYDTFSPISLFDDEGKLIFTLQPNRPIEFQQGQYSGKVFMYNYYRILSKTTYFPWYFRPYLMKEVRNVLKLKEKRLQYRYFSLCSNSYL